MHGAIILAAGYSSRMGDFKPLLPMRLTSQGKEEKVVDRVIESAVDAGLSPIILVTGHGHQELQEHLQKKEETKVEIRRNEEFAKGMFTSIQAGIGALTEKGEELSGCFLLPVDCPAIGRETIRTMEAEIQRQGQKGKHFFSVPTFRGKKGHPLYVPKRYWEEILTYQGDRGLKGVTDAHPEEMAYINVADEGCLLDMDDPAGYEKVMAYLRDQEEGNDRRYGFGRTLSELGQGRRFFLIRHGQILQHREKIFLGQTDVPLSEEGIGQAKAAGKKMADLFRSFAPQSATPFIYTSPLSRARETAHWVAREMAATWKEGEPTIREEVDLQEMALGEWDGKYIRQVKEACPEEFARRGRDLFSFKQGNHSENFYDLQYRVDRCLKGILLSDPAPQIIIVSHKGVLRVIENNLKGGDVQDDWEPMENGQIRVISL